ncbi:hypothetical protein FB45DRAFT_1017560 [Roridomyces roridus]|uniref:Uncharacterized protein n=1 Tax=Roridomyces roridus TaxID=1738132 RepID=A0AAD7G287_9AGAR|nr:hypothetical protein FB45DRAFT_1017560 [Roridomyces roridus]
MALQVMIRGLYDTAVDFLALRNPTPPPSGPAPAYFDRGTLPDATDLAEPSLMRRGTENIANQLARSQAEVARLEERCRQLERALKGTREMLESREAELDQLRKSSSTGSLTDETQDNYQGRRSRSRLTTPLLEEQRAQALGSEMYMTRVDTWSGQQVIQAVRDLNSEIIQLASSAVELCTFDIQNPSSPQAMQDTSARLGSNLAGLLSARERNSQDPTLVGLALQAGMATAIARAMATFALGLPSRSETVLSSLYSHIFVSEPQPTSSRWRSLAHKHVHTLYPGLADYAAEELRETLCRWTSDILVAAGASHESTSPSRAWIRETFGDQVGRMVKSTAGIATICREEIMSTNFDILSVEPGQLFDVRIMEDALGYTTSAHGAVLATTELGLRRMTRKNASDRTIEQQLLCRPKVIMHSVAEVFS